MYAIIKPLTVEVAQALGAKKWVSKSGETRFYFNNLADLYGLRCRYYHTGNIASATLDGEKISNNSAQALSSILYAAKVYFSPSEEKVHFSGISDAKAKCIAAEIFARAKAAAKPVTQKITSDLNRRAWAIRREAAARLGVSLMSVVWGECLKMARAG